jgi:hypothetical protein
MIILTNTTDKIQVKLGTTVTTNQMRCFASYRDTTTTSITPLRNVITTNDTTYVDLVGSPTASTQRIVDYLSVFNSDTGNEIVTISFNDNGTLYELFVATLSPGEKIEFQEGLGFKVMSNAGSVKTSVNQGNSPATSTLNAVILGSDVINANAVANTIADVTGLSFPVLAGKAYYFKFIINYSTALTTTGSRWSISGPTTTSLCFMSEYSLTTTTSTRNATIVTYDLPITSNASSAQLIGNNAIIEGYIIPSVDGTVTARCASEVTLSAITAKAGSVCYYQQLT